MNEENQYTKEELYEMYPVFNVKRFLAAVSVCGVLMVLASIFL